MTDQPVTRDALDRFAVGLGREFAKMLAQFREAEITPLRAEIGLLRTELAGTRSAAEARGVRHRFTEVLADPADPGAALLMLEDGSSVRVRREQAARWHDAVAGRA